ncbi:type I restriction-modification system subunit M [Chitinophagaceae bacterium LB-8]|uniref:site-specific DNA-methyltransferase (adenine-specific) n=1 Tax=Paraflavisolibacter caeni TaxID=2982496 RepID=A0A9X2XT95_9BACT|nr:class I SAM-dependent DNA methyltransferase [Paraflavisolibacter caeni]MCU7548140.1 type I restriction-modification system subunit M [Paraflavisolibacter caeni]
MSVLTSTIKSIQDIMRKDAGVDGDAQRISQLGWMLFLKIFDEKENDWEIINEEYKSPIPKDLRWRNWAADEEGMTGDELLDFVNNSLFPRLKDLKLHHNKDAVRMVRDVFEDSYNYMKSGTLLRQVINKINSDIHLSTQADRHAFNDIYEQILRDLQSAGNAGEFYTPRPITQFVVEMVNPKLGEKVLDPACGTAGFLTNVIEHIQRNEGVKTLAERAKLQNGIWGVEKKPLPHMLATTNMILHGIELPSIDHDNLLSYSYIDFSTRRVDVIVTNPPFGGMEEDGVEKNFPVQFRTRETANLFMALIMQMLKDGGRCGVVLPDGFLFGEGVATRIKETLLEKCNLHTIVRLPNGVFAPYTGIKTNLLFFEKDTPTKEVWYFEHPYPDGVKNYNKTRPISIKEFDLEKAWWNRRVENEYAWKVSVKEIKNRNYNLDIKNPNVVKEQHEYASSELMELLSKSFKKSNELLEELKKGLV